MAEALLVLDGVSKAFGGLRAVQDVSLALPAGTLGADPLLGTFDFHGGLTPVFDLGAGSPAIDAGDNPMELPCDQRGGILVSLASFTMTARHERIVGAHADIGAFETGAGERLFRNGFEFFGETCYRER